MNVGRGYWWLWPIGVLGAVFADCLGLSLCPISALPLCPLSVLSPLFCCFSRPLALSTQNTELSTQNTQLNICVYINA